MHCVIAYLERFNSTTITSNFLDEKNGCSGEIELMINCEWVGSELLGELDRKRGKGGGGLIQENTQLGERPPEVFRLEIPGI